jgi:hypothetical protein
MDAATIALTPLVTIVIAADGGATVDGQPVPDSGSADPRADALAEVRIRAARLNRPVRVNAKEADGSVWPMLVDPAGQVHILDTPHPLPELPVPPPPAETAAPVVSVATGWLDEPPDHGDLVELVRQAEQDGNLDAAAAAAEDLESALVDANGETHPHTVNAIHVRAYLALLAEDWAPCTRLHLTAAQLRHRLGAPADETLRLARNATAAWRRLEEGDERLVSGQHLLTLLQAVAPGQAPAFARRLEALVQDGAQ